MNIEVLKTIFSVPGAIIIVALLFFLIVILRPGLLKNLRLKGKKKDVEFEFESKAEEFKKVPKKIESHKEIQIPDENKTQQEKEKIVDEVKADDRQYIDKAFEAFERKNLEDFIHNWNVVLENSEEPLKSSRLIYKSYFSYVLGAADALEELKKFGDKDDKNSILARNLLADIYIDLKSLDKALELIKKNIELSAEPKEKLSFWLKLCGLKIKAKQYTETEEILRKLRDQYKDDLSLAKIIMKLGQLYEKLGREDLATKYYEKALAYDPSNDSLRFDLARKYSNMKQDEMSILHYYVLVSHNYSPGSVKNNLGVSFENLNLVIKANNFYKDSLDSGESLAGANITYNYINAGFIDSAKEILIRAQEMPNVHENVKKAFVLIDEKNDYESSEEKKLLDLANIKKEFFLKVFDTYDFKSRVEEDKILGIWKLPSGELSLLKENKKIYGELKYNSDVINIHGKLDNFILFIDFETGIYFKKIGNGFLIFSEACAEFDGLLIGYPDAREFVTIKGIRA